MDIETYYRILLKRGEDPHEQIHKEPRGVIAFASDLLNNKVVWYNDFKQDWKAYMKVQHPLYGCFHSPKYHPFSRKERRVVLFLGLGFAAFWAAMNTYSCAGECQDPEIWVEMIGALLKFLVYSVLKFMAICPCCQKEGCCLQCKSSCEFLGCFVLIIWSVVIFFMMIAVIALAASNDAIGSFFFSFAFVNIFSWILQILYLSLKFKFKWNREKKNAKILQKLKIHYIEYEKFEKGNIIDTSVFKGLIQVSPMPSNAPVMQPQMQHRMSQHGQQMQPQPVNVIRPMQQQQQGVQRQLFQVQRVPVQQSLVHYAPVQQNQMIMAQGVPMQPVQGQTIQMVSYQGHPVQMMSAQGQPIQMMPPQGQHIVMMPLQQQRQSIPAPISPMPIPSAPPQQIYQSQCQQKQPISNNLAQFQYHPKEGSS